MAKKKFDYEKLVQLKHNEIAAIINVETGDVKEVSNWKPTLPINKEVWQKNVKFKKHFEPSDMIMDWLEDNEILTDLELRVLQRLTRRIKFETNSLEPLNDEYAIQSIADEYRVGRNKVTPLLKKFYNLGLYGKFDVKKYNVPYTKYWILNPYLCHKGRLIDSDISKLFEGTLIHILYMEFDALITSRDAR